MAIMISIWISFLLGNESDLILVLEVTGSLREQIYKYLDDPLITFTEVFIFNLFNIKLGQDNKFCGH